MNAIRRNRIFSIQLRKKKFHFFLCVLFLLFLFSDKKTSWGGNELHIMSENTAGKCFQTKLSKFQVIPSLDWIRRRNLDYMHKSNGSTNRKYRRSEIGLEFITPNIGWPNNDWEPIKNNQGKNIIQIIIRNEWINVKSRESKL